MSRLCEPMIWVDGDILAYRAASATDGRQYVVKYNLGQGEVVTYEKYKKDADKLAKSYPGSSVELVFQPEPEENALHVLKKSIVSLETNLKVHCDGIDHLFMTISNKGSFREKIYPPYKNNREGMRKPKHLMACKNWLLNNYKGQCESGRWEADDIMAMKQTEWNDKELPSVIASIDKDLMQIPGWHFNFVKNVFTYVSETEGTNFLYQQMLMGDATDGIPGLKGVGPVGAKKLLANVQSEYMMYCVVLKEYIARSEQFTDETFEDFTIRMVATVRIHAQLLYLLRYEGDEWNAPLAE